MVSTRPVWAAGPLRQVEGDVLDFIQAGVLADGAGLEAGDLEAVVLGGVVGGGDLDAAAGAQVVDGEVDLRGIDHADVDDVGAGGEDAVDEGLGQGG